MGWLWICWWVGYNIMCQDGSDGFIYLQLFLFLTVARLQWDFWHRLCFFPCLSSVCHIHFAVKVKEHSNPDADKGSKRSAGAYDFATAKPQSENEWTLNEARWGIENNGYSSSGENRINWIKWIYYSLVCHFSAELFCGRSTRQVQRSTVFRLLPSCYTHCI